MVPYGSMTAASWVLTVWGTLTSAAWCALAAMGLRTSLHFKKFGELHAPPPSAWPRVSVIVAACDEGDTIGPALETLLGQDYPDLEIVVVDDRSKDATGAIVDAAAAKDTRVRAVHVTALPEGWLGKVHALHRGTQMATGSWLLFTDADVHFSAAALRRAIAFVEAAGVDHLAVAPDLHAKGVAQDIVSAAFATAFMIGTRAMDVGKPGSKAYAGVGAFNLVRRAAFDRTPGFEWLRLEVLDDVGLGLMLHNAGAKGAFAIGFEHVQIDWYPSLAAMARGLEKNMYGAFCRYRLPRLIAMVVALAVFVPGPIVALFAQPRPWIPLLGGVTIAFLAANAVILAVRTQRSAFRFFFAPIGGVILALLVVRSAWRCLSDGGVTWRGTLYPLKALRDAQRVKL
jgi:glycosyltransferase involved in cell wall biosynthesis